MEAVYTVDTLGCLLDGHWGWHNAYRLVDIATNLGMTLTEEDAAIVERYRNDDATEDDHSAMIDQGGINDDARTYLEARCAPGVVLEFDMGEVTITTLCRTEGYDPDMDECECGTCDQLD